MNNFYILCTTVRRKHSANTIVYRDILGVERVGVGGGDGDEVMEGCLWS